MKILMINGSPHLNGCIGTALGMVAEELNKQGIETETIHVGNKDIRGCIGCGTCESKGQCVFDDLVNETLPKLAECDGMVVGSPVYYASANGTLVSFLDRLFYANHADLTMKVGASVVSARRGGTTATFDELNKYFTISSMPVVSSQYWNMVHGNSKEDVLADEEGCQIMRTLGKNMAFMIKSIALGKEKFGLPEKEEHVWTNFIR
ncbi:flavodoxin family protein [Butyrivibrio sp. INlla16]|uniref:flavodoxin family protein n=1 Tax=Butyrivibrio sp. INlla16 TaxID=1520807 RepID=UPI0008820C37|nr:flavodoxin family protein [Butyrivibrio sp. INlla16]SDB50039.1 Multimeric flavodoxin WrbA [Butyrivibrio sp. INlla16]